MDFLLYEVSAQQGDAQTHPPRSDAHPQAPPIDRHLPRIKRIGFGFTRFTNYRIRVLLYAGKPNWDLLPTITPR
jgi:hypothetical protein